MPDPKSPLRPFLLLEIIIGSWGSRKNLNKSQLDFQKPGSPWQVSVPEPPLRRSSLLETTIRSRKHPNYPKKFQPEKTRISLTGLRSWTIFETWKFLWLMRLSWSFPCISKIPPKLQKVEKIRTRSWKKVDVSEMTQAWNHLWDLKSPRRFKTIRKTSPHLETITKE